MLASVQICGSEGVATEDFCHKWLYCLFIKVTVRYICQIIQNLLKDLLRKMATPLNVTITAIFAFLVSTIVFSSSSVRACLTCGTPDPVDITSRIHCGEKMSSIINGINGKWYNNNFLK